MTFLELEPPPLYSTIPNNIGFGIHIVRFRRFDDVECNSVALPPFLFHLQSLTSTESHREYFWEQLKASRITETLHSSDAEDDTKLIIGAFDNEIALARSYTQELRTRHNALISVVQFPSELLATIFHLLLPVRERRSEEVSETSVDMDCEIAANTRSLIAASHVCRRWRDVALQSSSLWAVLWTTNKFWLSEMLVRAKDSPLVILQLHDNEWMNTPTSHLRECMNILTPRLFETKQPRHMRLLLNMNKKTLVDAWSKVLSRSAPVLEVLQVFTTTMYFDDFAPLVIAADFLGGHAPALRSLTLKGPCSHQALWSSPVLRGLVNLTLALTPPGTTQNVSLQDTLTALRSMQQLETLCIEFPPSWPLQPSYFLSNSSQEGIVVRLPHLTFLSVNGGMTDATTLTKCLLLPPRADIQCEIRVTEEQVSHPQMPGDIAALLHPVLPIRSTMEVYEINFSYHPEPFLCVRAWEHALPMDHYLDHYPVRPRLTLTFTIRNEHLPGVFPQPQNMVELFERGTRNLVKTLAMLSPLLPRDQPHDLRWGITRWPYANCLLIIDDSPITEVLNTIPETRRLIFNSIRSCRDIISGAANDPGLLRNLESIHFIGHPPSDSSMPLPNGMSMEDTIYKDIAGDLRLVAKTRDIHVIECRGGLIKEEYVHLFEGIARELVWSQDVRDAV